MNELSCRWISKCWDWNFAQFLRSWRGNSNTQRDTQLVFINFCCVHKPEETPDETTTPPDTQSQRPRSGRSQAAEEPRGGRFGFYESKWNCIYKSGLKSALLSSLQQHGVSFTHWETFTAVNQSQVRILPSVRWCMTVRKWEGEVSEKVQLIKK